MSLDAVWVVEGKHPMDRDWYPESCWIAKVEADNEMQAMITYELRNIADERRCQYRVRKYTVQPPERGAK